MTKGKRRRKDRPRLALFGVRGQKCTITAYHGVQAKDIHIDWDL